jgi:predicted O-methyltransferase YrrM
MAFPDYRTWVDAVVHPRERIATRNSPWCFESETWHAHYRRKHDIAWALNPRSIMEIGVRYGYSAHAFLSACPDAFYTGVDSDDPAHNAMGEPTLAWAEGMLGKALPDGAEHDYRITMVRLNTREKPLPSRLGGYDLIHIDADHSYAGCRDDLRKAWPLCGRAILVDDFGAIAAVQDAVFAFLRDNPATMLKTDGFLGDALILKGSP